MKISRFTVAVLIGAILIEVTVLIASAVASRASSMSTERDGVVSASSDLSALMPYEPLTTNDPYLEKQWALTQLEPNRLWQVTEGKPGVIVAVLDTGIDNYHEDLTGKVIAELSFADSPTPGDVHGHGTHIAGIIAASTNNDVGITGLAPAAKLINVKVADDGGHCRASSLARGIYWAVYNGCHIINISIELREPSIELERAVNYAWSRGVLVVGAAGNDGGQCVAYPAFYQNCVAVAALKQDQTLAPLSNYGDWVDVFAPGYDIYSTLPGDRYGYKTGTSFAAAQGSGLAALLFNVVADTDGDAKLNDEVRAAIEARLPHAWK